MNAIILHSNRFGWVIYVGIRCKGFLGLPWNTCTFHTKKNIIINMFINIIISPKGGLLPWCRVYLHKVMLHPTPIWHFYLIHDWYVTSNITYFNNFILCYKILQIVFWEGRVYWQIINNISHISIPYYILKRQTQLTLCREQWSRPFHIFYCFWHDLCKHKSPANALQVLNMLINILISEKLIFGR